MTGAYESGEEALRAQDFARAAACFEQALGEGANVAAHRGLADALLRLGRVDEGIASLRRWIASAPGDMRAHAKLIHWMDFSPSATLDEQQRERRLWCELHAGEPAGTSDAFVNTRDEGRRLRIGYVSADFRRHAAVLAFGPLLRTYDRDAFEVFCYSAARVEDEWTVALRKSVDEWRPVAAASDDAVAAMVRKDRIDILVDLSGHTAGTRLGVFARRAAPLQMSGWGHANGTGLRSMDYLLSDRIAIPPHVRQMFTERVVDLPCCLCYQPADDGPEVSPPPAGGGETFTFGCLNRAEKISELAVAAWSRILREMPQSRMLLKSAPLENPVLRAELTRRFALQGIGAERLLLRGRTSTVEHLKALDSVSLALDPFPCNGGITTMETLWMGVPVVALLGRTTIGRIAAAVLTATGMADWVARDEDEYVRISLEFADDPGYLAMLRADMRRRLAASEAFDGRRYTRAVEDAYRSVWRNWCREGAG